MTDELIIDKFKFIEGNLTNLNDIYRSNLRAWYYNNSDVKDLGNDNSLRFNNGLLVNNLIKSSKMKDDFPLSENDFIDEELSAINNLDVDKLSFGYLKRFNIYKLHLENKKYNINYSYKSEQDIFLERTYKFNKYLTAINSVYFPRVIIKQEDGNDNLFYFTFTLQHWQEFRLSLLTSNKLLQSRQKLIKLFIVTLFRLGNSIVEVFIAVFESKKYSGAQLNKYNRYMNQVEDALLSIEEHSAIINHNIDTGHYKTALHLQHSFMLLFDDILDYINTQLSINIYKSPLKKRFKKTREILKSAIDLPKLELMSKITDDENVSQYETNFEEIGISEVIDLEDELYVEVSKNEDIFHNYTGRVVFSAMHNIYSKNSKHRSDYSFLYYQLRERKYINANPEKYLKYIHFHGIKNVESLDTKMISGVGQSKAVEERIKFLDAKIDEIIKELREDKNNPIVT